MEVINEVRPSDPKQIEQMAEKGPDGPIFMVNLLNMVLIATATKGL